MVFKVKKLLLSSKEPDCSNLSEDYVALLASRMQILSLQQRRNCRILFSYMYSYEVGVCV